MSDLVAWLLAQLDADEATARALVVPAHDGYKPHPELSEWCVGNTGEVEYLQTPEMLAHKYADPWYVTCDGEGLTPSVDGPTAAHIATHDPARVLAEVEAKRAIVAIHEGWHVCPYADPTRGRGSTDVTDEGDDWVPLCPTLLALARPFAGRPGWDESWRINTHKETQR